jgi:hypothetical protein
MRAFGIQFSPLSGDIHIGRLNRKNTAFLEKEAATYQAVGAVAELIDQQHSGQMTVTSNSGVSYTLRVSYEGES